MLTKIVNFIYLLSLQKISSPLLIYLLFLNKILLAIIYLLTSLLTSYLPSYILSYLLSYLVTYFYTFLLTYLPTYLLNTCLNSYGALLRNIQILCRDFPFEFLLIIVGALGYIPAYVLLQIYGRTLFWRKRSQEIY